MSLQSQNRQVFVVRPLFVFLWKDVEDTRIETFSQILKTNTDAHLYLFVHFFLIKAIKKGHLFFCIHFLCSQRVKQMLVSDWSVWTITQSRSKHWHSQWLSWATGPQTGVWWRESFSGLLFTSFFSFHKERVGNHLVQLVRDFEPTGQYKTNRLLSEKTFRWFLLADSYTQSSPWEWKILVHSSLYSKWKWFYTVGGFVRNFWLRVFCISVTHLSNSVLKSWNCRFRSCLLCTRGCECSGCSDDQ